MIKSAGIIIATTAPLIAFLIFGLSVGQTQSYDQDQWQQALDLYHQGDFGSAAIHLQKIIREADSPYESAARLLLSKCYLNLGLLKQAEDAAEALICRFPHGCYTPYAHYVKAQIDFQHEKFVACALQLLTAAEETDDDELNTLARNKLERLFEVYLPEEQKDKLLSWIEEPEIHADLAAIRQGYKLPLKVGVILPLTGLQSGEGQSILEGIEQACAEARKRWRLFIEIVARDSEGNSVEAARAAKSLIQEENVVALIGDLDKQCTTVIASVATERSVPVIIPACSETGLTTIGEGVFQLLADYEIEGRILAVFARRLLGVRRIGILAPASDEGMQRVRGFQTEFERLAGEIINVQWYYEETANFRRQLAGLAQVGTKKSPDGGEAILANAEVEDSLEEGRTINVLPDSTTESMPINFLEALYIPVQGDEIAIIASQLATLGYRGKLLGSARCLDLVHRETNRRYLEGMYFPAHFPSNIHFTAEADFEKAYQARVGSRPDRGNVLGWDAFNYLASGLKETGKISPPRICRRLEELRRFPGTRIELSFPKDSRINHSLYILSLTQGEITVVKTTQDFLPDDSP